MEVALQLHLISYKLRLPLHTITDWVRSDCALTAFSTDNPDSTKLTLSTEDSFAVISFSASDISPYVLLDDGCISCEVPTSLSKTQPVLGSASTHVDLTDSLNIPIKTEFPDSGLNQSENCAEFQEDFLDQSDFSPSDNMSSSSLVCVPCDKTFRTDKSLKSHLAHCKSQPDEAVSTDAQETSYILDPVTGDLLVIEPEGGTDHVDSDQQIEQLEDVAFTKDYVDQPIEELEDVAIDEETINISDENSLDAGEQDDISIEVDDINDPPYKASGFTNSESKPKTGAHECSVCHKTFNTYAARVSHLRSKHGLTAKLAPAKDYTKECLICKKMIQFGKIDRHMVTHTGEKPYKCDVCNKRFTDKAYIKKHHETQHSKMKTETPPPSDPCEYCGKMVRKTYMKQHLGSVCKEAPAHLKLPVQLFPCPECGQICKSKNALKFHLEVHSDTVYTCAVCSKEFRTENALVTHLRETHQLNRHLEHVDDPLWPCEVCGKTFKKQARLKRHNRRHTGEKNYHCDVCGVRFAEAGSLNKHRRTRHEGIYRFQCNRCGRKMDTATFLRKHNCSYIGRGLRIRSDDEVFAGSKLNKNTAKRRMRVPLPVPSAPNSALYSQDQMGKHSSKRKLRVPLPVPSAPDPILFADHPPSVGPPERPVNIRDVLQDAKKHAIIQEVIVEDFLNSDEDEEDGHQEILKNLKEQPIILKEIDEEAIDDMVKIEVDDNSIAILNQDLLGEDSECSS